MKFRFLDEARKEALKSTYKHRIGSVLVYKGQIVGRGFNDPKKSHPRANTPFKTIHGEFAAILKCPVRFLKGSEMYVYRHRISGTPGCSKPCEFCFQLLKKLGIKKVYYTTGDDNYWECLEL